jgi:4-amino-4-deoxy-L-arabinose transferase-like glycosyltransferase
VAFSLAAFGNNETAARIPSAVFGIALAALAFAFCRKIYGTRCGLLAAIVIVTTPLFVMNARTVIFDMALAFFVCGAIFAGYLAEEAEGRTRRNWYLLGAASAGFATLVKGPIGFLIPALVLLIFNRIEGRRGAWRRLLSPLNLLVFFGVTLPWFVGLCLAHRDFLHYGLVEETFRRFTTSKTFHRSRPVYFYLLHHRRDVFSVEPAAAGGGPGGVEGTLGETPRRPPVPDLVGGGGGVLFHLPVQAAGVHPERDRFIRHPPGADVRCGAGGSGWPGRPAWWDAQPWYSPWSACWWRRRWRWRRVCGRCTC